MTHDIATNRLFRVGNKRHPGAWIGRHLVGHNDNEIELFADFLKPACSS
jgi:hypothetical protein